MKKSKQIAISGVLSGLSFVLLFIGALIPSFTYVAPILAGLVQIASNNNINKKSSWCIFIVTSIISIFFVANKECALTYIFFFGYYPIIKGNIANIKNKCIRVLLKFVIFNFGIITSQLICVYIFGIPFDEFLGKWGIAILIILANILFVIYEKSLFMVEVLYMKKIYSKVKQILK